MKFLVSKGGGPVKKFLKGISLYIVLFVVIMLFYMVLRYQPTTRKELNYSQLVSHLKQNNVAELTITPEQAGSPAGVIEGRLTDNTAFAVNIPDLGNFMQNYVDPETVVVNTREVPKTNWLVNLLPTLLFMVVIVFIWIFFINQSQGGGGGSRVMSFGKSRARKGIGKTKVTFEDVAGADEEKAELQEIVEFLKAPKKFRDIGARIPKGVLLVGPPGTGKTLLAKAVAGEAGVQFFSISGSDFVEMFVGVGASRVRDLFQEAKKEAPCIVFIDEIDAVGRQRGAGLGGGHDEREQTLNQLLVEMDGFADHEDIIVIAATNRPDILDSALLRPGRFDRQILVGRPDVKGREQILKVHSRTKPLDSDIDLATIAKQTAGFTGADLENLLNEAALLSARHNKTRITMNEVEEAVIKVVAGPEKKSRVITEKERKLTAYHEAGHAIVGHVLPNIDPIHQISIIPRGMAGGYTMHLPQEDKSYASKTEMSEEIVSLLGGRAAEELILNDISTGASNDIQRATKIARNMVTKYGMGKLGPIMFGSEQDEVFIGRDFAQTRNYGEKIASEIDAEIREIIMEGYTKAKSILTENMDKLHEVAKILLEKEKIDGKEFEALFSDL